MGGWVGGRRFLPFVAGFEFLEELLSKALGIVEDLGGWVGGWWVGWWVGGGGREWMGR